MYFAIDLHQDPPAMSLEDIDNFRVFQIEAAGPRERIDSALTPYGTWDGEHGWFAPARVQELAGDRAGDEGWQRGFTAMQKYAAEHGYLGERGDLRAHVEWRD